MPTVWLIVVVGGPILLLAVLLYARFANRKKESGWTEERSDAGAENLRREIERDREAFEEHR
jgi:hypothetical protein